jgi:hypothetical protein
MKRKVSEFSYGFVLTHELVNAYGYLTTDSPQNSRKRKKKDSGDAADGAPSGYPMFLQFKASEYMQRRNAGESKLVGLPFEQRVFRSSGSGLFAFCQSGRDRRVAGQSISSCCLQ